MDSLTCTTNFISATASLLVCSSTVMSLPDRVMTISPLLPISSVLRMKCWKSASLRASMRDRCGRARSARRSGRNRSAVVAAERPDVVLVDLNLGEGRPGGVEITAALRGLSPAPEVMVLTTYDTEADVLRALDAGARGILDEIYRSAQRH